MFLSFNIIKFFTTLLSETLFFFYKKKKKGVKDIVHCIKNSNFFNSKLILVNSILLFYWLVWYKIASHEICTFFNENKSISIMFSLNCVIYFMKIINENIILFNKNVIVVDSLKKY